MCGIVTSISRDNEKFDNKYKVWNQYKKQKERGVQGYGFLADEPNGLHYFRCKEEESVKRELDNLVDPNFIIFHHRKPTTTAPPNDGKVNHPIQVSHKELDYDYYVIHNGSIRNDEELKEQHEKLDYEYKTEVKTKRGKYEREKFNDSESLAIEVSRYLDGRQDHMGATGAIAFFCLQVGKKSNEPKKLFYFRNSKRPMKMYRNQYGTFFSSEGKGKDLETNNIYEINLDTHEFKILGMPPKSITNDEDDKKKSTVESSQETIGFLPPKEKTEKPPAEVVDGIKDMREIAKHAGDMDLTNDYHIDNFEEVNGIQYNLKDNHVIERLSAFFRDFNEFKADYDVKYEIMRLASDLSDQNDILERQEEKLDDLNADIAEEMRDRSSKEDITMADLRTQTYNTEHNIKEIERSIKTLREKIITTINQVMV